MIECKHENIDADIDQTGWDMYDLVIECFDCSKKFKEDEVVILTKEAVEQMQAVIKLGKKYKKAYTRTATVIAETKSSTRLFLFEAIEAYEGTP